MVIPYKRFRVIYTVASPDPHGFDGNHDALDARSNRRRQRGALDDPVDVRGWRGTFEAVCAHELEGVVATRPAERYRPGERGR
jgi:hypothetical protein